MRIDSISREDEERLVQARARARARRAADVEGPMSDEPTRRPRRTRRRRAPRRPTPCRVAAHPRARASIRRTRARTALVAFALVLFLSLQAGVPGQEAAMRAVLAGLVGNLVGWALRAGRLAPDRASRRCGLVEDARRERARARAELLPPPPRRGRRLTQLTTRGPDRPDRAGPQRPARRPDATSRRSSASARRSAANASAQAPPESRLRRALRPRSEGGSGGLDVRGLNFFLKSVSAQADEPVCKKG